MSKERERQFDAHSQLLSSEAIVKARGRKNDLDTWQPYQFLVEPEVSRFGTIDDVATLFLTNRECPFQCIFCDLWQNTTDETVPVGAIPAQIDFALLRLPPASHIKLYNSGNFFDPKAIPVQDWPEIASRVARFQTVIVENHPRLCSNRCGEFQQMCGTQVEVAMGLETSHEPTLALLNKQMTTADFSRACELLLQQGLLIRSFVLLKPPMTSEVEAIERAIESVRFAFDCGVGCVSVIPVRTGNGIMDRLREDHAWTPPLLSSLETVLSETLSWKRGRVFGDLWDARQFADDMLRADEQIARIEKMNFTQRIC